MVAAMPANDVGTLLSALPQNPAAALSLPASIWRAPGAMVADAAASVWMPRLLELIRSSASASNSGTAVSPEVEAALYLAARNAVVRCGHLSSALPSLRRDASPAAGRLAAAALARLKHGGGKKSASAAAAAASLVVVAALDTFPASLRPHTKDLVSWAERAALDGRSPGAAAVLARAARVGGSGSGGSTSSSSSDDFSRLAQSLLATANAALDALLLVSGGGGEDPALVEAARRSLSPGARVLSPAAALLLPSEGNGVAGRGATDTSGSGAPPLDDSAAVLGGCLDTLDQMLSLPFLNSNSSSSGSASSKSCSNVSFPLVRPPAAGVVALAARCLGAPRPPRGLRAAALALLAALLASSRGVPALACDAASAARVVGDALRQAGSSFLSSDGDDADGGGAAPSSMSSPLSSSPSSSSSSRHALFVKERLSLYAAASSACVRCGVAAAVRLAGPLLRLAERDVLGAGSRRRKTAASPRPAAAQKRKKDASVAGGGSSLLLLLPPSLARGDGDAASSDALVAAAALDAVVALLAGAGAALPAAERAKADGLAARAAVSASAAAAAGSSSSAAAAEEARAASLRLLTTTLLSPAAHRPANLPLAVSLLSDAGAGACSGSPVVAAVGRRGLVCAEALLHARAVPLRGGVDAEGAEAELWGADWGKGNGDWTRGEEEKAEEEEEEEEEAKRSAAAKAAASAPAPPPAAAAISPRQALAAATTAVAAPPPPLERAWEPPPPPQQQQQPPVAAAEAAVAAAAAAAAAVAAPAAVDKDDNENSELPSIDSGCSDSVEDDEEVS